MMSNDESVRHGAATLGIRRARLVRGNHTGTICMGDDGLDEHLVAIVHSFAFEFRARVRVRRLVDDGGMAERAGGWGVLADGEIEAVLERVLIVAGFDVGVGGRGHGGEDEGGGIASRRRRLAVIVALVFLVVRGSDG